MSKFDKLISKFNSLSNDIRFEEITKIMNHYGYKLTRPGSGSSHYTFRKDGHFPVNIPKHRPIKKVYIELIKQIIEEEEQNDKRS